jgi:hypothetical protein
MLAAQPVGGRTVRYGAIALCLGLLSTGCDKLKGALGKGGDAGAPASSSGGGSILSFLGTDFEGEITANVTTKTKAQRDVPSQIVFGIHKPKYRIDTSGGAPSDNPQRVSGGSFIIDPPAKKGWLLVPAQKMAMVVDFEKMKTMPKGQIPGMPNAPKGTPSAPPTQPPKIEKTGKKDVVAGYACDVWNILSEGKKVEACVAEGITWIDLTDLGMSSPELAVAAIATEANRFPLRVISFDAKGAEEARMETTKIEKKKLDDARFVVPPDYRVIDVAQMMGGLGGLPGGPGFAPPKTR